MGGKPDGDRGAGVAHVLKAPLLPGIGLLSKFGKSKGAPALDR
jgi:hypothetical protein